MNCYYHMKESTRTSDRIFLQEQLANAKARLDETHEIGAFVAIRVKKQRQADAAQLPENESS